MPEVQKSACWYWIDPNGQTNENLMLLQSLELLQVQVKPFPSYLKFEQILKNNQES